MTKQEDVIRLREIPLEQRGAFVEFTWAKDSPVVNIEDPMEQWDYYYRKDYLSFLGKNP